MAFQLQQKDFDIATALGGNDITLGNNIVTNFRQDTALTIDRAYPYIGEVDGVTYHFNTRGECKENPSLSLKLSSIDINHTKGDTGDILDTSNIIEFNPREQIAIAAMQSILSTMENPLELSDFKLVQLSKKSFLLAKAMLQQAAEERKNDSTSEDIPIPASEEVTEG